MNSTVKIIFRAFKLILIMIVLTGVIYPLCITGISKIFFNKQANGSIIEKNGVNVGSKFIGQYFNEPEFFWGRPSSTSEYSYNTLGACGSNESPANKEFNAILDERIKNLKKYDKNNTTKIPVDLVTSSASGLDPNISIEGTIYQVNRVSKYSGVEKDILLKLINKHSEKPIGGVLGNSKINVLELNLELIDLMDK